MNTIRFIIARVTGSAEVAEDDTFVNGLKRLERREPRKNLACTPFRNQPKHQAA
ncbi:hypothetical protein [Aliigemmobacter aestuarii]|uniref:hypothetical protein n=1 Tax=Aliigemmobacter aestuarii TaxID=1445661 RepID=UPI001454C8C8|nr:hypothetical protein [Gemmobacter aestuarii]